MTPHQWTFRDQHLTTVYNGLEQSTQRYLKFLDKGKTSGELEPMAWIARSILELLVWATYCTLSNENAERRTVLYGYSS